LYEEYDNGHQNPDKLSMDKGCTLIVATKGLIGDLLLPKTECPMSQFHRLPGVGQYWSGVAAEND